MSRVCYDFNLLKLNGRMQNIILEKAPAKSTFIRSWIRINSRQETIDIWLNLTGTAEKDCNNWGGGE